MNKPLLPLPLPLRAILDQLVTKCQMIQVCHANAHMEDAATDKVMETRCSAWSHIEFGTSLKKNDVSVEHPAFVNCSTKETQANKSSKTCVKQDSQVSTKTTACHIFFSPRGEIGITPR